MADAAVMDSVKQSTATDGGDAARPPTAIIHEYLRKFGLQPNAENVRRVLEANANNPDLIPGLRNDAPPPADTVSSGAGGKAGARGVGSAPIASGTGNEALPTPPIPPSAPPDENLPIPPIPPGAPNGAQAGGEGDMSWIVPAISALLAGGGALGGAYGAHRMMNRGFGGGGDGAEYVGNVGSQFRSAAPQDALPAPENMGAPAIAQEPMQRALSQAVDEPSLPRVSSDAAAPQRVGTPSGPSPQPGVQQLTQDPLQAALEKAVGQPRTAGIPSQSPTPQGRPIGPTSSVSPQLSPDILSEFMRLLRGVGARR